MQPLKTEDFLLAPFLRSLAVTYLNEVCEKNYEIELKISDDIENIYMNGDKALLNRAMGNLIGNCIRHNPSGCHIFISAMLLSSCVCSVCIRDNGIGIPEHVIQALSQKASSQEAPFQGASSQDALSANGFPRNASPQNAFSSDTFPQDAFSHTMASSSEKPHIMGLRIARQIVLSHQGNFYFSTDRHGILMEFPVITTFSPPVP